MTTQDVKPTDVAEKVADIHTDKPLVMTWKDIDLLNNEEYLSESLDGFLEVLTHYEPNLLDTLEAEIWDIARKSDKIPDLAEIAHNLVLRKIARAIIAKAEKENGLLYWNAPLQSREPVAEFVGGCIQWYVDGRYLDFYINEERIFNIADINTQIAEVIKKMKEEGE